MRSRTPGGRRRRTQQSNGDHGIPLLPILVAVVLIGFVIGAALSTWRRAQDDASLTAASSSAPEVVATDSPSPTPTPRRSTPFPAIVPTIVHTFTPPEPTPTRQPAPPTPTASPTPTLAPTVAPTETAASAPAPTTLSSPSSAPEQTETLAPSAAPTTAIEVDSEFAGEAAQAVRAYLNAIQRGDEDAAYAALGGTADTPDLVLSEEGFMDRTARIVSIHATGTSTDATARADVVTQSGEYVATYKLERGPKGPIIRSHDFTRVR